jgi:hypothetical protein
MQNVAEWTFGVALATLLVTIVIAYYNRYSLIYAMQMFEIAKFELAKLSQEKKQEYNYKNYSD